MREAYKADPIEDFHGKLIDGFHRYREEIIAGRREPLSKGVLIDGKTFNQIVVDAKNSVLSDA